MASPVGVSALIADDVIKFVLPTFLGLSLLAPFWNPRISADALLFVSLFAGFTATPVIANAYLWCAGKLRKDGKTLRKVFAAHGRRWRYNRVFHSGDKDTRNAITLTDAKATLTLLISCYFMLFAAAAIAWAIAKNWPVEGELQSWLRSVGMTRVPLVFSQEAPAVVCFAVAVVIWIRSYRDYFAQQRMQFSVQYPEAARKLHIEKGDVAKAVWGAIELTTPTERSTRASSSPASGCEVALTIDGIPGVIAEAEVDEFGEFTFIVDPYRFVGSTLVATLVENGASSSLAMADRKTVPEFRVGVDPATLASHADSLAPRPPENSS